MQARRLALTALGSAVALVIVAGCSSSAKSTDATAPVPTDTVTQTDTVNQPSLPTGSGVPASSSPAPSSSGNAAGPGLCTPTVMTFAVGAGNGAAGTVYSSIVATNASSSPCVTTGWPGVAILNASGQQLAQAARTGAQGSTITVQPGAKIHAVLSSSDVPSGGSNATCSTVPAILFTLPDNTDSTQIKGPGMTACDPKVQAFQAGAS